MDTTPRRNKQTELTLEKLQSLDPNTTFAFGKSKDSINGIMISNSLDEVQWVAVRGKELDWAIYYGWATDNMENVQEYGHKVYNTGTIRRLVPCTDEVFELYNRVPTGKERELVRDVESEPSIEEWREENE